MPCTIDLIGLPTDVNSSFERGPAQAPAVIRAALWSDRGNLACENGMEIGAEIALNDLGDLLLTEAATDDALIRDAVSASITRGAVPILLGGDHAVTFPILEAIAEHHGPIHILHIDAHPDLYDDFGGNPRSHASPFARIMERGLAASLTQIGIRTLNRHCREQAERFHVTIMDAVNFVPEDVQLPAGPTYLSIDLDGFDPAYAPGVSHHEPGGLSVREVLKTLRCVPGPIVGADIVELNPRFDVNQVTAILAAKLVREISARITETHERPRP